MTALKRAKVLFAELGNDDLLEWVSYEIAGYPADANLPDYRKVRGRLVGSYIKGSMASHMKWTNVSLPLGTMPDNIQEALLSVYFREGVGALRQLAESSKEDGQLGKTIDADLFPVIATYNNDPYMYITSANVLIGPQLIQDVFSTVESIEGIHKQNIRKVQQKQFFHVHLCTLRSLTFTFSRSMVRCSVFSAACSFARVSRSRMEGLSSRLILRLANS